VLLDVGSALLEEGCELVLVGAELLVDEELLDVCAADEEDGAADEKLEELEPTEEDVLDCAADEEDGAPDETLEELEPTDDVLAAPDTDEETEELVVEDAAAEGPLEELETTTDDELAAPEADEETEELDELTPGGGVVPFIYISIRLPAPQYSYSSPGQMKLQSPWFGASIAEGSMEFAQ